VNVLKQAEKLKQDAPRVELKSIESVFELIESGTGTLAFIQFPLSDSKGGYVKVAGKKYRRGDTVSVEEFIAFNGWERFVNLEYMATHSRVEAHEKHQEMKTVQEELSGPKATYQRTETAIAKAKKELAHHEGQVNAWKGKIVDLKKDLKEAKREMEKIIG